jgi:hypothetical protein
LIDGTAKKLADEFFAAFAARLATPAAGGHATPMATPAAIAPARTEKPSPWLWAIAIGSVVAAILVYVLTR